MTATIKEIAKRANVSIATVSRALNNDSSVKPQTKNKILRVSEELNYTPNLLARSFVTKKSNIIGLIVPELSDEFFSEIIRGVDEVAYSQGYFPLIASSHKNRTVVESIYAFTSSGFVSGVMLLIPCLTNELKHALSHKKIPFVLITGGNISKNYDSVGIDNFQGSYDMVHYLVNTKGFKKIAHISGPNDNDDANLRKEGFIKACQDLGIKIHKPWLIESDFTKLGGELACKQIFKQMNLPEVIFAANDMMAIGCYDIIYSQGLKIPKDIGVVGFDDILISKYLSPPLTTVKVQIAEVGKTAVKILLDKLNSGNDYTNKNVKITTDIVIRRSC